MKKIIVVLFMAFGFTTISADAQAQTVKEERKTKNGWSKKKKGAVIGGATGAATGVAVSKNNSKGAIIGGVVGAGGGYLYGRHKEKKNPTTKKVYKYKKTVE